MASDGIARRRPERAAEAGPAEGCASAATTGGSSRCSSRAPKTPLPAGFPIELARTHPTWRYALEPSAQCELEDGHGAGTDELDVARRHRSGGLLWWDPPIVLVGDAARVGS